MSVRYDLTGNKYGRLTVLCLSTDIPGKKKKWMCRCECGNEVEIAGYNLTSGHSTQCKQCQLEQMWSGQVKHNKSGTKLYGVWATMIRRCEDPKNKSYSNYHGKGISVCAEWHDSTTFFDWATNNGYEEGLQLDRIDTNGNYEPSNCRWVTQLKNARNKTNNKRIEYNGETKTLSEWAEHFGVNYKNLSRNLIKGDSMEEAVERIRSGTRTHRGSKASKKARCD